MRRYVPNAKGNEMAWDRIRSKCPKITKSALDLFCREEQLPVQHAPILSEEDCYTVIERRYRHEPSELP